MNITFHIAEKVDESKFFIAKNSQQLSSSLHDHYKKVIKHVVDEMGSSVVEYLPASTIERG